MMAESLDDGEFWLPPQFLADDDDMFDEETSVVTHTTTDSNLISQPGRALFPFEFGTFGAFSDFSSSGGSLKGLSETESDEEDSVAGLTLRMARSTIDDSKARVSGSPQSTLFDMGSGSGCSQGSSRGSPKAHCKVSSPTATWDLLHAAAGEVARMRMSESHGVHDSSSRGISTPQVSVPVNNCNNGAGFYQQLQAMQIQQEIMQRQQQIHQMVHGGDRRSAWLPPQQQHGSGVRALFLGTQGTKRECAGTGVFLPRHVATQSEPRKKPACSTVLVPARVMQALNLNLDDICSQPHLQPVATGRFNPDNDLVLRLESNRGMSNQRRNSRRQSAMDNELKLPQEWTY